MTTSVRALILRAFDHHAPTAQDVLRRRGDEVAKLRAELASVRGERDRLFSENVRLSAELAAANVERDELKAGIQDLRDRLDSSARQRNTAKFWVGR